MNWGSGFTSEYYATVVDPKTWRDIRQLDIKNGSVLRSDTDLIESADIETGEPPNGETWIRLWLKADQGDTETEPLFTGLVSAPHRDIDGKRESCDMECYSVLKPVDDIFTQRGYYIPADVSAPAAAARLLRRGIAPVEVSESSNLALTEAVIAEDGETCLTMALKALKVINWHIRIDGRGIIHVEPVPDGIAARLDSNEMDIMELSITDAKDWYSCPNVLRVIYGDITVIARDDDADSELSTVSRGREIWAEESISSLSSNESPGAYAQRRLKELQSPARTIAYTRRFLPDVTIGDVVYVNHPEIGIEGKFRITSQSYDLTFGSSTREEATII